MKILHLHWSLFVIFFYNMKFSKSIYIWTGAALAVIIVVLTLLKLTGPTTNPDGKDKIMGRISLKIDASDQVRGNRESKVILVEYSDFACPACAANEAMINKLVNDYRDRVAFVYRHFPLPYHIHSFEAARAAEAAGRQGKFWDLADLLFSRQKEWSTSPDFTSLLSDYAKTIGLDEMKFKADMQDPAIKSKIDADIESAKAAGLDHTPTYYLNGVEIINPSSYEEFKKIIDDALQKAN